jgi:hypothetical protein
MLARVLVFAGSILTVLPLVFWFAVQNAVQMAHDTLPSGVEQYATHSSSYLNPCSLCRFGRRRGATARGYRLVDTRALVCLNDAAVHFREPPHRCTYGWISVDGRGCGPAWRRYRGR